MTADDPIRCGCCGLLVAQCVEMDYDDDHPATIEGADPGSRYGS